MAATFEPMFVPPRENPLVIGLAMRILPALARFVAGIHDVRLAPEDLARLTALLDSRALMSSNHPTGDDPVVFFWLSKLLGQPFNYMAAREVLVGRKGWLLNRLGTYSVIRGVPDREALRMTRKLLAELDRKVVIFPEGEIYEHNDRLLSFQTGVPQLGFWALDDLEKAGKPLALPLVPVAIKYRCCDSPRPMIEASLTGLERAVDLDPSPKAGHYTRLLRIGNCVLCRLEEEEGLKPGEEQDLSTRIAAVRVRVMERVARAVGGTVKAGEPIQEQLHHLFHDLKSFVGLPSGDFSDYDERLYRHRMETAEPLFHDLHRLQNFLVLSGDYVAAKATAERFLEVLGRIEKEVFGELRTKPPREALVRIAPPIRLEERYDAYRENKRAVVAEVTRELESTIRTMLHELGEQATPISLES